MRQFFSYDQSWECITFLPCLCITICNTYNMVISTKAFMKSFPFKVNSKQGDEELHEAWCVLLHFHDSQDYVIQRY